MNSIDVGRDRHALLLGLRAQDRDPGLEVRRRQVGDEAPLEARPEPLLEGQDRLRRPVGGQHDLLAVLVDRVERVEELFLGPFLVRDELDVVDQQQVDPAVAGPEVVDLALLDRRDELVGELLAGRVHDALARELADDRVADRVHQVGLAQADAAIQEQRVVGVTGTLGDRERRRVGQAVGRADDEVREGVAGIEVGRAGGRALGSPDPGRLHADGAAGGFGSVAGGGAGGRPVRLALRGHHELDLDAVADHAGQRLGDQGPVAGLEPVLGEAVGDGDPEPLIVNVDEARIAQPRLVVGGRKRNLELSERGAPDLLRVHPTIVILSAGLRWVAPTTGPTEAGRRG